MFNRKRTTTDPPGRSFTQGSHSKKPKRTLVMFAGIAATRNVAAPLILLLLASAALIATTCQLVSAARSDLRLLVVTVATSPTTDLSRDESFVRFNRSIEAYGLDLVVLGAAANKKTEQEATQSAPTTAKQPNQPDSGRQKLHLLRKALASYKGEQDLVIMVLADSGNSIVNGAPKDILHRFDAKFSPKTRVVFSAESRCWPDASLESRYPPLPVAGGKGGERFLNSGAFIGYAPALWELLVNASSSAPPVEVAADSGGAGGGSDGFDQFQLYFTRAYLEPEVRQRLAIELDHRAELFQNLHSTASDVELEFGSDNVKLRNLAYLTEPVVVHAGAGNIESRVVLNSLGNYLGKAWTMRDGCRHCNESMVSLAKLKDSELPSVLVGLFIEEPTPFIEDFFESLRELNYPRQRLHLFVHSTVEYHDKLLSGFLGQFGPQCASLALAKSYPASATTTTTTTSPNSGDSMTAATILSPMAEWEARQFALDRCKQLACDHYLALDSVARIELPDTLRILIATNKTIVAPLLSRPTKLWSNFWGSLTSEGFYARSHDYVELVRRDREGLWNVPHVMNAYLIDGRFIRRTLEEAAGSKSALAYRDSPSSGGGARVLATARKPVLEFTRRLRAANLFQYMLNTHDFGHLVDPTTYNLSRTHPDLYQLKANPLDWERHYLHDNYTAIDIEPAPDAKSPEAAASVVSKAPAAVDELIEQPCQDVYWFPLVSERFCRELIEVMEAFGQWSGGTNHDPRIEGGYESVPTRDIHMKQVGLHELWLAFLRDYVMPVQLHKFVGYEHDPPRAELAFVVRYHPAEQASLRPHHDSSTYTLNIALNSPQLDYEGGGCRFVRYNCSVTQSRRGWALIHPGRLTHYHEGLPVTKGTRYIMVTFVDP